MKHVVVWITLKVYKDIDRALLPNERPNIKRPTDSYFHLLCDECGGKLECDENVEEKHHGTLKTNCHKTRKNEDFEKTSDAYCYLLEPKKCAIQSPDMC